MHACTEYQIFFDLGMLAVLLKHLPPFDSWPLLFSVALHTYTYTHTHTHNTTHTHTHTHTHTQHTHTRTQHTHNTHKHTHTHTHTHTQHQTGLLKSHKNEACLM